MLNFTSNINFTYIRLYLVYGPNQKEDRLIPYVINSCIKNKKIFLSNPNNLRDFIYVEDVAKCLIKILKNTKSNGQIYNLASGKPISVKQITEMIVNKLGKGKIYYKKLLKQKNNNKSLYANVYKAKRDLKWAPKIDINDGLDRTIKYYKEIYGKN